MEHTTTDCPRSPKKNVINICEEVSDELDKDRDPDDEAHEGAPNAAGASVDKVITAVHMPEAVYCDNLTDLPQMVHREASISLGDIRLEHDEADMRPMNGTDPTKSVAVGGGCRGARRLCPEG
jgi:hypothetical protein